MASLPPQEEYRALVKRINSSSYLLNKQLQRICMQNSMKSSGVKADLQSRVVEALNAAYTAGDAHNFRKIEDSIYRERQDLTATRGYAAAATTTGASQSHVHSTRSPGLPSSASLGQSSSMSSGYAGYQQANGLSGFGSYGATNGQRAQNMPSQGPSYHPSPFYHLVERIGNTHICEVMTQHRNSINIIIQPQAYPILQQCITDKTLRVMVFCAASNFGTQDIAFPHQSELKVNGDDVKANLRGLKNKPGSTRPVDITDLLRLKIPTYHNTVEFTYALTQKAGEKAFQSQRFYLSIHVCKSIHVDNLVQTISSRKISKGSVIKELTKKAHDAEIELSSQVLSLKCPLSYMRLNTPIRATTCTHVQCFDATSYLQLQQQGPQWVCPVCSKSAPFERLAIDEYVRDILNNTPTSVEQIDIEPSGRWKMHKPTEALANPEPQYDAFELDDDDLVVSEINQSRDYSTNSPNTVGPATGVLTPASGFSKEGSSSISRPGGTKRAHEVIDLTLSDEDDEESSQPPSKRIQLLRSFPSGPSAFL